MRTQSSRVAVTLACSPAPRSDSCAPAPTAVTMTSPGARVPSHRPCWTRWTSVPGALGKCASPMVAG
eukprot:2351131-Lingulodinium_polyedra.AAC.1